MAAPTDDTPFPGAPGGPYVDGFNVTPNDSVDLAKVTNAIHVGTAGNLHCITSKGTEITFAITAGWHKIRLHRIYSTSTTAAGISGWV